MCSSDLTLFLSNILFWKEYGYFGTPVEEKPLIHTWSLSIEEQFYIIYPILLIFFLQVNGFLFLKQDLPMETVNIRVARL